MSLRRLELVARQRAEAPVERVWEVFADAARWPAWSQVVAQVSAVPERWAPGERLAFTLRMAGATVPFDVRLEACAPPHHVRWASVRWTVTGTRTHRFEPDGSGSLLTDQKVFEHAWWPLAVAYPRGVIRAMSARWLADLAAEAARGGP